MKFTFVEKMPTWFIQIMILLLLKQVEKEELVE